MRISMARIRQELSGNDTTTITVAKGYCVPSRHALTRILTPYHVWFDAPMLDQYGPKNSDGLPTFQKCEIVVKKKQAAWAEYLLLSAKSPQGGSIFRVLSKPHNAKNLAYAQRRNGLPMPWDLTSGKMKDSWVETDCAEASQAKHKPGKGKKVSTLKGYGGILYTKERQPRRRRTRP